MKILFAIKSFNRLGGGAERVLADVSSGLADRGHQVWVMTYDAEDGGSFYPLSESITRLNLGIGSPEKSAKVKQTLVRMLALRRSTVQIDPDIVVGFMHSVFIPLGLALSGTKFPVIASEHIGAEYYRSRPFQHFLLQLTPYLTNRTTVISEKVREGYNAHLRKQMVVIPNPVSVPPTNKDASSKPDRTRKVLLAVGRFEPQKDHKVLLEAFGLVAVDFPEWNLRIVGDGELRPRLEAQARELGLQERIQLPGVTKEIGREYAGADLFVMPSLYESFGLATAEALTHGLPAIGFADCPGTNELIIHDRNGILVQGPERAVALADGLRRAMSSPELRKRLGAQGPDSMSIYSRQRICDKWEGLLEKWRRA